nr:MAG TPA: hypothetical protein [Caudoviricetes sp.]
MSKVVNRNGCEIDFDAALPFMYDEIKEKVEEVLPYWFSDQDYFTVYEEEYEKTTGEEWFLSSANPVW